MRQRLVIPSHLYQQLHEHLVSAAPSEDGAFLLAHCGSGQESQRYVVHELLLPAMADAWEARGNHRLRPSGRWLSAAIGAAIETNSALVFVHSHPDTNHPPHLSPIDRETSLAWATTIVPTLGTPLLSVVWTTGGLDGLIFEPSDPTEALHIDSFEVNGGGRRRVLSRVTTPHSDGALDDRQRRALGELGNASLRSLSVVLVGTGGTGSPLAEQLARMGVARLTLIDDDVIDTPSNLRRIVGSTASDLDRKSSKANVVARYLNESAVGCFVQPLTVDVRTTQALRAMIDADVVLCTTDTHSSRAFINQVAAQYAIPVVDVGTVVGTAQDGSVSGMPVEIRVLLPDNGCLVCRGALDPRRIRAENLPPAELAKERAEGYVQGVGEPVASLAALNSFAASAAALAMLHMLAVDGVASDAYVIDGWALYVHTLMGSIDPGCPCATWRGMADNVSVPTIT